jgi:O-antigen/teichoic acid export membrane protein
MVLSIQFIVMAISIIPQSLLERQMRFKALSIVEFASAIVGSLATLLLALLGMEVWALVWGSISLLVVRTIALNIVCPFSWRPSFSIEGMFQIISFGSYITGSRVLWYFYTQADIFIVGRLLGKELLGFYSVAVQLASLPMEKVSGIVNQVAFPAFANIQNDRQKAGRHFLQSVRLMSIVAFPVLWGISSIAAEMLHILLGGKWQVAAIPLQLLTLVMPIRMISNLFSPALMGLGYANVHFRNVLLASLIMPVVIWAGSHWGITGVCLGWIIGFPLVFVVNMLRVLKALEIRPIIVAKVIANAIGGSSIMYCAVAITKHILDQWALSIPGLITMVIVGAGVYACMLLVFDRESYKDVYNLITA